MYTYTTIILCVHACARACVRVCVNVRLLTYFDIINFRLSSIIILVLRRSFHKFSCGVILNDYDNL